jgi:hypothetical protein
MASKQALIEAAKAAKGPFTSRAQRDHELQVADILLHTASVNALIASAEAQAAGVALLQDIAVALREARR